MLNKPLDERSSRLYDLSVTDWPGEIDFYNQLIEKIEKPQKTILEIGCGTGRVAIQLGRKGRKLTGIDLSESMLKIAHQKSEGRVDLNWIRADMKKFDLGQTFDLVIIPGHSFQFMLTPMDQRTCLDHLKQHLAPNGSAVIHIDHQDLAWLGELRSGKGGIFESAGEVADPQTRDQIRVYKAWTYEPVTQTASCLTRREVIGTNGQLVDRWETGPTHLHCFFRYEMEHLLLRAGFSIEALYGDFFKNSLDEKSTEMVWVIRPEKTPR